MIVFAVDPGTTTSAWVCWDGQRVRTHGTEANEFVLLMLKDPFPSPTMVVFEQIESMGMAVGKEVFETVFWTGRFYEAVLGPRDRLTRRAVKLHLCETMQAKDANIRQAILDRFGATKAAAVGTKAQPGPLYGVTGHEWAALAVALTWYDQHQDEVGDDDGRRLPPYDRDRDNPLGG